MKKSFDTADCVRYPGHAHDRVWKLYAENGAEEAHLEDLVNLAPKYFRIGSTTVHRCVLYAPSWIAETVGIMDEINAAEWLVKG